MNKNGYANDDAEQKAKDAVFAYIRACLEEERVRLQAELAQEKAELAERDCQALWREVRRLGAKPGIYSFKVLGRWALSIKEYVDYPRPEKIVE